MTNRISQRDIGWVAGILEGEGSFYRQNNSFRVKVKMIDKDTIDRLPEVTGIGYVNGPYEGVNYSNWVWNVTNQREAIGLMMMVYSLMSRRRQAKIKQLLLEWRALPIFKRRRYPMHLTWEERAEWSALVNPR